MITWAIALIRAISVPGFRSSTVSAKRVIGTLRGSATIILAPFLYALIILFAITGCVSFVLEPIIKMTSIFSISLMELVIAPEPKIAAKLATVGACQRRAQWSTLFVPTAALIIFWKA